MRRTFLNLIAGAAVFAGGLVLTTSPGEAATCTGPAGAGGCTCTSGDGNYTCTGDSCTSNGTSCTGTDAQIQPE